MKKFVVFIGAFVLVSCMPKGPQASYILPLYPLAQWSEPQKAERSFDREGVLTTVQGKEVMGTVDDENRKQFFYTDSEFRDDDFWRYYLVDETLMKIGYQTIFVEEYKEDRQFVGLRDDDGHVLLLSNIVEFANDNQDEPECPCTYTFTIFTNDERVVLED
ncbi:hypothetical protein KKC44_04915 [Patescibacteria group bacterium]|nr:hypothetical protein [Patescibacteria group bacterium]